MKTNNYTYNERIKSFYNSSDKALKEFINDVIKRNWKDKDINFSISIAYDEYTFYYYANKKNGKRIQNKKENTDNIEQQIQQFRTLLNCNHGFVEFCRHIGTWENQLRKPVKIYYYWSINIDLKINNLLFQSLDTVFFNYIYSELVVLMNSIEPETINNAFDLSMNKSNIFKTLRKQFYMFWGIDLSIISELSGIRYEKQVCHSKLVFLLDDNLIFDSENTNRVNFEEKIPLNLDNTKKIRKCLQMGNDNLYILVQKNRDNNQWEITGLYPFSTLPKHNITFNMEDHMIWSMYINNLFAVCYKYGKVIIDNNNLKYEFFCEKYLQTFKSDPSSEMRNVFNGAIEQKHGTTIIILEEKNKTKDEINRLFTDSIGIKITPCTLTSDLIHSVTSIDGALITNPNGKCFGIGVILDSSEKIEGARLTDKGARHTSAHKYIIKCRQNHIKGLAIVVSEDGPVSIFSTTDN